MNREHLNNLAREMSDKNFARGQLGRAVKKGDVTKDTCYCGSEDVEAHHPDYTKPLEVIWACKKHHVALDIMRRESELERTTGIVIH